MSYKISLNKNNLGFLKSYNKVSDKNTGRYLIMLLSKESDGNYVSFEMTTTEVDIITKVKNESIELSGYSETSLAFPLSDFYNFISLLNDGEEFILEDNVFKTKKGTYPIRELSQEIAIPPVATINDVQFTKVKLMQLEKLKTVKSYIGSDLTGFDSVLYQGGNYSAYSERNGCLIKNNGIEVSDEAVHLSPKMCDVLEIIDSESVTLNLQKDQDVSVIRNDDTIYIFKTNKGYATPNLNADNIANQWMHPFEIKFNYADFIGVLNKFKVLSTEEIAKLLFKIEFTDGKMHLETMNGLSGTAFETIDAQVPDDLIGLKIPISVGATFDSLKAFPLNNNETLVFMLKATEENWVPMFGIKSATDDTVYTLLATLSEMTEG